jgi:Protein of unknown function (DUF4065)
MAPLFSSQLKDLVLGILDLIRLEGGFATKTKLLKLLYLADIESYRDTRSLLTGFDWIFYLYGPWTPQYDQLIGEMHSNDLIVIAPGSDPESGAQFVRPRTTGNLDRVQLPVVTWACIRRCVRLWANEPTGALLNYVYFHTEPMRDAIRGERLDFPTLATRDTAPLYRRTRSSPDKKQLKEARKQIRQAPPRLGSQAQNFTAPIYDETFFQAVSALDEQSE